MIFRGYTYALRPTPDQAETFAKFAGVCRLVWNLALEQRRDHWRRYHAATGSALNAIAQQRELTALRAEFDFIRAVHVTPQQRTIKALDEAYRRAFKGQSGFPRAKKKGVNDSFSFAGREVSVDRINHRWGRIRLPKIGWVKFRMTREVLGRITEVTIARTAIGWQVSIGCAIDAITSDNGLTVGIDRGVNVPLMLSDGTGYNLPPNISALEQKHRRAQRVVSRRKVGSRRWAAALRRAARVKAKQARARKHWAHCSTSEICRHYGGVVIERLRIKNMTATATGTMQSPGGNVAQKRGMNRAILNVGWHQIEAMLFYKAARLIKVDPAYTSQTCSSCGTVDRQSRKNQASFVCTACGHRDNADRNAAINILNRGSTPGVEPCRWVGDEARSIAA